jgi:alanine dehydrogenase
MRIGVPKEIKDKENRVGMVVAGVRALTEAGHEVWVQKDAGLGAEIRNEDYERVGAKIIEDAQSIWSSSDMIVKVKEPLPEEYPLMQEGQILYTYLHLANEKDLTMALMEKGVTAIAYETIQAPDGTLPLLTPMSEVAGRMATQIGAHYLQKDQDGRGVLLGGVPGVERARVTVIGVGVAGYNAAKIAIGMGAQVHLIDRNIKRLAHLEDIFQDRPITLHSNAENVEYSVTHSDLVIGAVLVPGARAPKLVSKDMIEKMKPGSVVVDIAVDQGGCIETCRPTSHSKPIYKINGVTHYCVPNMPGAVARTSTFALTNVTTRYAVEIAQHGIKNALERNPELQSGMNVIQGKLVYKQVADDLDLPYFPLQQIQWPN